MGRRGIHICYMGKPEGKRPLGGPRHERVDNIRMDLVEIGRSDMDWNEQ
jgi:hypothetical protein